MHKIKYRKKALMKEPMEKIFHIREKLTSDGFTVIEVTNHLDVTNSNQINNLVEQLVKKGIKKILFDFYQVSFVDSSGIRALVVSKKKLDSIGGVLKITNINADVKDMFSMLHLEQLIEIIES